jgi:MoxR-like ATPase
MTSLPATEPEVSALLDRLGGLRTEIAKVIVGQQDAVDELLTAFLAGGHALLEGVPGLAKTLLIRTLADAVDLSFRRIQFTPDLMPSDILGTEVLEEDHTTGRRFFSFTRGPVFANIVLADEINRTPPKTQAALLQAMQERAVTVDGVTYELVDGFFVIATQNPIEQEGTYPLPEAQLDRFMLLIKVNYPTAADERGMLDRMSTLEVPVPREIATVDQVRAARKVVGSVYIDDRVRDYIVHIVQATRKPRDYGLAELAPLIEYGASPRATLCLAAAARAHAFIRHRAYVTPDDIKAIALDVMRHRVVVTYEAEAEEVSSEDVVRRVFEYLPVP